MSRGLTSLGCGLLFGIGLLLSGMTDPRNIIGFLDFVGDFNPKLLAVMVAAVGVHAAALRWLRPRSATSAASAWRQPVDGRLIVGAAIFGVGWGLAGYCPGPAIVSAGSGVLSAAAFVLAMVVGIASGQIAFTTMSK
ncbi:MAG TPA: DUF6691 family protein [Polyangia bacterium]|jgi:uncharacterized membrane protein YedE/YeeE|nr:DUF6691 family protein [Polyangia bacterium]